MRILKTLFSSAILLIVAFSCTSEEVPEVKKEEPVVEQKITDSTSFKNDVYNYSQAPEAVGV